MSDAAGPANPSSPSNPPGTGDRGSESRANAPKRGSEGRPAAARSFQAPKGTRDFYPADLLRRRYIIDTWRRVSLRHGFEEIDGPTFEDSDLYTVKSGEGILNELFGAYSGKDPNDTKQVQAGGPPPFALRPEFTPTLARMYAARARQLPQPTKWFCVSNFFRAERPQRGRLREFWQWNADTLGDNSVVADAETAGLSIECLIDCGVSEGVCTLSVSDRTVIERLLSEGNVPIENRDAIYHVLDKAEKLGPRFVEEARAIGMPEGLILVFSPTGLSHPAVDLTTTTHKHVIDASTSPLLSDWRSISDRFFSFFERGLKPFQDAMLQFQHSSRSVKGTASIVRGLAYYTGTVFELIAEGERAVAGGGRYDKLIELFGGPPTPAVGFGMGDVVLTNLLDDRKLMPEGRDLLEACSRPLPVRCDVFVVANEKDEAQAQVVPTVAALRRGVESETYRQGGCKPWSLERYDVAPLHARRSYKTTKNIGKLLGDATACHARFALIIEDGEKGTLKNLDTREEFKDVALSEVGKRVSGGPGL